MRRIVVLLRLELRELALDADARGHGERAEVIRRRRRFGRDEVGEAVVRLARRAARSAGAGCARSARALGARIVRVAARCRRRSAFAGQKPDDAVRGEPAAVDDALSSIACLRS